MDTVATRCARWQGKRVFLTGHTGFKGAWLALWLQSWGAEVYGFSLAPEQPSLFQQLNLAGQINGEYNDIRDSEKIATAMKRFAPDVVFHLAAQPLVRASYLDPVGTYATNVMGTVHVLDAVRQTGGVKAVVIVTSDKCYDNQEWSWSYRENDRLGGRDPYSNSKACAELVVQSYRSSYFSAATDVLVATARAGNVIGGGDWAQDRLIPDAVRAFSAHKPLVIRYPDAVRPWQHVLEAVNGYLVLAEGLLAGGQSLATAWNFGPLPQAFSTVRGVVESCVQLWGGDAEWRCEPTQAWHEAGLLTLDITKTTRYLPWKPQLTLGEALSLTMEWYQADDHSEQPMLDFSRRQMNGFLDLI